MTRLQVALIGAGAMAARHARVLADSSRATLAVVVDREAARAAALAAEHCAEASDSIEAVLRCDAAIIATATPAHHDAALMLLAAGIPLLVEKPLTASLPETRAVVASATVLDRVLMCGFVERFNAHYVALRSRQTARADHIVAVRNSARPTRVHSSVIDDVLIHDLDLALGLLADHSVASIEASATDWDACHHWPDTVTCVLSFGSGTTVRLEASRAASTRRRVLTTTSGARLDSVDLDCAPGNALAAQLRYFIDLINDGTAQQRQTERRGILQAHDLAESVRLAVGAPS